jgi:hypothetical protein
MLADREQDIYQHLYDSLENTDQITMVWEEVLKLIAE